VTCQTNSRVLHIQIIILIDYPTISEISSFSRHSRVNFMKFVEKVLLLNRNNKVGDDNF